VCARAQAPHNCKMEAEIRVRRRRCPPQRRCFSGGIHGPLAKGAWTVDKRRIPSKMNADDGTTSNTARRACASCGNLELGCEGECAESNPEPMEKESGTERHRRGKLENGDGSDTRKINSGRASKRGKQSACRVMLLRGNRGEGEKQPPRPPQKKRQAGRQAIFQA